MYLAEAEGGRKKAQGYTFWKIPGSPGGWVCRVMPERWCPDSRHRVGQALHREWNHHHGGLSMGTPPAEDPGARHSLTLNITIDPAPHLPPQRHGRGVLALLKLWISVHESPTVSIVEASGFIRLKPLFPEVVRNEATPSRDVGHLGGHGQGSSPSPGSMCPSQGEES